jgi:O-antigen/teichoic acid export membrane protein
MTLQGISELTTTADETEGAGSAVADLNAARRQRRTLYFRALWSGAGARSVNIVAQVLSLALTVRYLGAERYGMWATISSFVAWLGLANFGLGNGLTTRLSAASAVGDREAADTAVSSTVATVGVISLALLAVGWGAAVLVPWQGVFKVSDPLAVAEARPAVLMTLSLVMLLLPVGLSASVLTGYQRGYLVNIAATIGSFIGLGALFAATRLRVGMPTLVAVLFLPTALAGAVQWGIIWRLGLARVSPRRVHLAEALRMTRLGAAFLLTELFALVVFQSGAVIIAQRFGAAHVTPYAVTSRMALVIITGFNVLISPLWPAYGEAFARGDRDWVRRIFWKSAGAVCVLWLPIALFLGLAGQWIIRIWAGPNAVPDRVLLWSMLAFTLAQALGTIVSHLLNGVGAMSSQIVGGAIMAALHIPLSLLLCARVGIAGVPISQAALMFTVAVPLAFFHVLRLIRREPTGLQGEGTCYQRESGGRSASGG